MKTMLKIFTVLFLTLNIMPVMAMGPYEDLNAKPEEISKEASQNTTDQKDDKKQAKLAKRTERQQTRQTNKATKETTCSNNGGNFKAGSCWCGARIMINPDTTKCKDGKIIKADEQEETPAIDSQNSGTQTANENTAGNNQSQTINNISASESTLDEKQQAYDNARATEQSKANRLLTSLSMAATGIGGMELAQGLSEQRADRVAEQSMSAYIATMRCSYGNGKQVKAGTEEIELPGGNDGNIMKYRAEYVTLAADLKERKTALGLKPGIESEEILDKSQMGLYDDENIGISDGAYASLYRAQMLGSEKDQQQIDDAKQTSKNRVIGGAVAAGVGVVGGIVGDELINQSLSSSTKTAQTCTESGGTWQGGRCHCPDGFIQHTKTGPCFAEQQKQETPETTPPQGQNSSSSNSNGNIEYSAEDKCYTTLGTWDDQYGDCFCPDLYTWDDSDGCVETEHEELDLSDVSITPSNINNNKPDINTYINESNIPNPLEIDKIYTYPTTNEDKIFTLFTEQCLDQNESLSATVQTFAATSNNTDIVCTCNTGYENKDNKCVPEQSTEHPKSANSDNNNPNMLKNVVERDIAAINATTAKLGAKIYVSGYPARLVPGDLGWELVDAYTDFNDRCSDLGEEYSSRPVDDRATGFGDELDLNTILTDTTPYALSECWCFTEAGYEKQGDKCVKRQVTERKTDDTKSNTSTAQRPSTTTAKATIPSDLSKQDMSKNGTFGKGYSVNGECEVYQKEANIIAWYTKSTSWCNDLYKGEWKVKFDYGLVRGKSACSINSNKLGNPDEETGPYCWCKVIQYTPNEGTAKNLSLSWVYDGTKYKDTSACLKYCAQDCAESIRADSDERQKMFNAK